MNPILQMLNNPNQPNLLAQISQMLSRKNPDEVFSELMKNNPEFRSFVEKNKGKTAEQIAKENGIDLTNILK